MMNSYVNRFLESNSAENLVSIFSGKNCKKPMKEISESWAMLVAFQKYFSDFEQEQTIVVVVGDGILPRTGILFAYFTKVARVISVDPSLDMERWGSFCSSQEKFCGRRPIGITLMNQYLEDCEFNIVKGNLVVVWPHSHAHMNSHGIKVFKNYKRRGDIAMPCCKEIPGNWMMVPHIVYDDKNVISPKRTIHVWKES